MSDYAVLNKKLNILNNIDFLRLLFMVSLVVINGNESFYRTKAKTSKDHKCNIQ